MAKKMKKMGRATGGPTPPPSFKKGKTVRQKKGFGGSIASGPGDNVFKEMASNLGPAIRDSFTPGGPEIFAGGGVCREHTQRRYMPHNRGYQVSAQAASHGVPVLQRAAGRYDKTHEKKDMKRNEMRAG